MNRRLLFAVLILKCLVGSTRADISKQELQKWVDHSALIFTGKLLSLGSNVDSIDIKDGAMIVKVERVESGNDEENFGSLVGKELTVIVDPSSRIQRPKEGISVVFFVNPLLYERNIAVTATAIADKKAAPDFSKQLSAAVQRKKEKPLKDAIKSSSAIVSGTVQEIRSLPETKLRPLRSFANGHDIFSEHSPRWKEALILVQSVLSGDPSIKMVLVVFPSTDDRAWADSPSFRAGESGIWLLQRGEVTKAEIGILLAPEKISGREIKAFTTLHSEDFQPKDPDGKNEARIREILKAPKP
jgi:hypothetical protein